MYSRHFLHLLILMINKKVLLRERKWNTARQVASPRSAVLSWGGVEGGTPT